MDKIIKPKTLESFVRSISGLFITNQNPQGITPTELLILCDFIKVAKTSAITKNVKEEVANNNNHGLQVISNYVNKFKKKGVILKDDRLHPIFFKDKIIIDGQGIM